MQLKNTIHSVVLQDSAHSIGWPANHCKPWIWGDEILVGAHAPFAKVNDRPTHLADFDRPGPVWMARSVDGGITWKKEIHPVLDNQRRMKDGPVWRGAEPVPLTQPFDFSHPDTILAFLFQDFRYGNSCFVVSHDRGRSWSPRYQLPRIGKVKRATEYLAVVRQMDGHAGDMAAGMFARSDYDVESATTVNLFCTIEKESGSEGRVVVLRTEDGGQTWFHHGDMTPRDVSPAGYYIMPSTVRCSDRELLSAVRVEIVDPEITGRDRVISARIELYGSVDNGRNWSLRSLLYEYEKIGSSPASMVRLADGRILCTYSVRLPDCPRIAAKISADGGFSWSDEIIIREDSGAWWDIGYIRSAQRTDGKLVSVYYWGESSSSPRYLAASIWELPIEVG